MSKTKVYAPNLAYSGEVGGVQFQDGVAEYDPADHPGADAYFRSAGYGIGKRASEPPAAVATFDGKPVDARDFGEPQPFGSPNRDAAVDPRPGDYLPPTNAGQADPHGPLVVSPEIHASGPAGIRSGEVFVDDVVRQETAETELAERVLVDGGPAVEAVPFDAEVNMGPLGLSDPGSVELGLRGAAEQAASAEAPNRTARVAEWRDFAVARGVRPEEAASLSRDELIERFG